MPHPPASEDGRGTMPHPEAPESGRGAMPARLPAEAEAPAPPVAASMARLLLAPLLLAQGLWVRARAPLLPEPPGPRAGVIGSGAPLRLLILGDSSAAGVGAPHQSEALSGQIAAALAPHVRLDWQLVASTGLTTSGALDRLRALPRAPVDIAVTVLGVNDVTRAVPHRRWIARQSALFDLLEGEFGARRILATAVPPMGAFPALPQPLRAVLGRDAARRDALLAALAATRPAVTHVPFPPLPGGATMARDGFHPGPAIYRIWGAALAAQIRAGLSAG